MLPALPTGMQCDVGRVAEHVDDLERGGLLPLDAERVDRVDDRRRRPRSPSSRTIVERVVEVAADRHDPRAVDERLRELAQRDVPLGDHDRARSARRAPRTPRPTPTCCRSTRRSTTLAPSSTAFEIAIVIPRSLNDPVGLSPSTLSSTRATPTCSRQPGRVEQRRVALEQRDDRRRVGDREALAVRLDQPGPRRPSRHSLLVADDPQHRADAVHRRRARAAASQRRPQVGLAGRWVMKIRRASSPMPLCCIDRIDTPCAPNTPAIAASTPGRSATSSEQVELRRRSRRSAGSASARACRSWRPARPRRRFMAASMRSPSTARRGRAAAGAAAVEHQLADGVALDEHRVEELAHRGQRVVDRHHRRVHPHRDLAVELLGDGEQLDDVAERAATAMSSAVMPLMPSWYTSPATTRAPNAIEAMIAALARRRSPRRRRSGRARRSPSACASASASAYDGALLGHPGEDVVGRAVDDAHHPADALAGERLAQRPDERDAAGDRRLEEQVDAGAVGRLEQLGADVGEQLLVGGDDRLAGLQRVERSARGPARCRR